MGSNTKKLLISFFLVFIIFTLNAESKFLGIAGNGALSPDKKWYISIRDVYHKDNKDVSYSRFEIINLEKNNFEARIHEGRELFTYGYEEMKKSIPELLLYTQVGGSSRYADIKWSDDSREIRVFFKGAVSTLVFYYNTKTRNVLTYEIQDEKFAQSLKREEDFEKNATPEEKRKRQENILKFIKESEEKYKKEKEKENIPSVSSKVKSTK